jgi:hypothetical protein
LALLSQSTLRQHSGVLMYPEYPFGHRLADQRMNAPPKPMIQSKTSGGVRFKPCAVPTIQTQRVQPMIPSTTTTAG